MEHTCSSLLFTCMDFRIQAAVSRYMVENSLRGDCDVVSLPGGQKMLADVLTRDNTMKMVNLSVELHGVTDIYLVAHDDCGAYGGSGKFKDRSAERKAYKADLEKAIANIKRKHPKMNIWVKLAVFDGERWTVIDFTEDGSVGETAHGGPPDFRSGAEADRAEAPAVVPEPEEDDNEDIVVDTTDDHQSEIVIGPDADEIIVGDDDEYAVVIDSDEIEVVVEDDEFEAEVIVEDEPSTVTKDPYWVSNTRERRRRL